MQEARQQQESKEKPMERQSKRNKPITSHQPNGGNSSGKKGQPNIQPLKDLNEMRSLRDQVRRQKNSSQYSGCSMPAAQPHSTKFTIPITGQNAESARDMSIEFRYNVQNSQKPIYSSNK